MKVKEIEVNYGVTVNTGVKFEFLRLDYTARITLDEGESASDMFKSVRVDLRNKITKAATQEIHYISGERG